MHYLDEYITEQTERNILSGYEKTVALEFINKQRAEEFAKNRTYAFKSYMDDTANGVLEIIVSNIFQGKVDAAYKLFMRLSNEVEEVAGKPEIVQKFWEKLLKYAQKKEE
jgi:predicted transcriptional regulator